MHVAPCKRKKTPVTGVNSVGTFLKEDDFGRGNIVGENKVIFESQTT